MKRLSAGNLRQRVTLRRPRLPEPLDSFGQPVRDWETVGTYWAWVRPLQGREAVVAKRVVAEATHAVTMRYLGRDVPLNPTMQLTLGGGGRAFGIVQVLNVDERNWHYELIAKEIQVTGGV